MRKTLSRYFSTSLAISSSSKVPPPSPELVEQLLKNADNPNIPSSPLAYHPPGSTTETSETSQTSRPSQTKPPPIIINTNIIKKSTNRTPNYPKPKVKQKLSEIKKQVDAEDNLSQFFQQVQGSFLDDFPHPIEPSSSSSINPNLTYHPNSSILERELPSSNSSSNSPPISPYDWRLRSPSRSNFGSGRLLSLGVGPPPSTPSQFIPPTSTPSSYKSSHWSKKRFPQKQSTLFPDLYFQPLDTYRATFDRLIDLSQKAEEDLLKDRIAIGKGGDAWRGKFKAIWREEGWRGGWVLDLILIDGPRKRVRLGELLKVVEVGMEGEVLMEKKKSTTESGSSSSSRTKDDMGLVMEADVEGKGFSLAFRTKTGLNEGIVKFVMFF